MSRRASYHSHRGLFVSAALHPQKLKIHPSAKITHRFVLLPPAPPAKIKKFIHPQK
jgi:hypothetical protein